MTKNEVISQIKTFLQDSVVRKMILFGSYSKGKQTNDTFVPDSFARQRQIKLKIAKALHILRKQADLDLIVRTKPMHVKFIPLYSRPWDRDY